MVQEFFIRNVFSTFFSEARDSDGEIERKFFIPEVVQTSGMDCGPATLKSMLEGFGISVSYGRLREACQTDVDGTSIDSIEEIAVQLGLQAEQIIIPRDHLLLDEAQALPAIVVTRLPNGTTHFVVVWRRMGNFVQVMDPASGRRWTTLSRFMDTVYTHTMPIPTAAWWDWAQSAGFIDPLFERMQLIGLDDNDIDPLVTDALARDDWFSMAALDASVRMVTSMVKADAAEQGREARDIIRELYNLIASRPANALELVPIPFWSVRPVDDNPDDEFVYFSGAVLVRVLGVRDVRRAARVLADYADADERDEADDKSKTATDDAADDELSPQLAAVLGDDDRQPIMLVLEELRKDGFLVPGMVSLAIIMASLTVIVESLILRSVLEVGMALSSTQDRINLIIAIISFFAALLLMEFPLSALMQRLGRRLELRLRVRFLEKIPNLSDRYFHSRLTSDMVQRAHDLRQLRTLPNLGIAVLRVFFQLIFTTIGVIILDPASLLLAFAATGASIALTIFTQPILIERDLRIRTHVGALSRFFLDAMVGLIPLRTHSAERAFRREHEGLMTEWQRSVLEMFRIDVWLHLIASLMGWFFSVAILFNYIASGGEASGVLLLFYWTLSIPALGQQMANLVQQYPIQRNRLLRLLEPLQAPDESSIEAYNAMAADVSDDERPADAVYDPDNGASIVMEQINVLAGGQTILRDINLTIRPGEHLAVVGPSGAGKSSLVGLLLGWHRPANGRLWVDGKILDGEQLYNLRDMTAWIDPDVHLWNKSLFANLHYGVKDDVALPVTDAIEQSNLFKVLQNLPEGLQTRLGEGGGLVSGGEGQRVRLARGLMRGDVRLVIMDEPFRGLDRPQRRELLRNVRDHWHNTTIISITHDVGETTNFERVLVIENGRIAEDGNPQDLINRESRYRQLLQADYAVNQGLWENALWRRIWLEGGRVEERSSGQSDKNVTDTDGNGADEPPPPQDEPPMQT